MSEKEKRSKDLETAEQGCKRSRELYTQVVGRIKLMGGLIFLQRRRKLELYLLFSI